MKTGYRVETDDRMMPDRTAEEGRLLPVPQQLFFPKKKIGVTGVLSMQL